MTPVRPDFSNGSNAKSPSHASRPAAPAVPAGSQAGSQASRRDFLRGSAAVVGAALATYAVAPSVYAAGSDELKIGLIGCGGRGSGAAVNALHAEPYAKVIALADMFPDKLETSLKNLRGASEVGERVQVPDDHKFTGWDAYKGVIDKCRRGPARHAAVLPPDAPQGGHRGRQALLLREARRHRRPRPALGPGDGQAGQAEEPQPRLGAVLPLRPAEGRDHEADPRRGDRPDHQHADQLPDRRALVQPAQARVERHGVAAPQLALLHLAERRPHRRAAHPQPGQVPVGDAGRAAGAGVRQRRPQRAARARSSATSTTTSTRPTSGPTA